MVSVGQIRPKFVDIGTYLSYLLAMTGNEFIRKIRRLGRKSGVPVSFDGGDGKGDHGKLWYGDRFTTVGDRGELRKGTLMAMLKQLGLTMEDLR